MSEEEKHWKIREVEKMINNPIAAATMIAGEMHLGSDHELPPEVEQNRLQMLAMLRQYDGINSSPPEPESPFSSTVPGKSIFQVETSNSETYCEDPIPQLYPMLRLREEPTFQIREDPMPQLRPMMSLHNG